MGGLGRVMIGAGVLILLFVAYQLWGTSLQTAQAQDELEDEFDDLLEQATATTAAADETTAAAETTTTEAGAPPTSIVPGTVSTTATRPAPGDPAGRIEIPRIGLEDVFVSGVRVADLKRGPGHYPDTPLPGEAGNAAIAGHRTTYGAPFKRIEELDPGDEILTTTLQGTFVYTVRETFIVRPNQSEVLQPTTVNQLTLTSCHPTYSAEKRIIVVADLQGQPVAVPMPPAEGDGGEGDGGEGDGGEAGSGGGGVGEATTDTAPDSSAELDVSGESASRTPAVVWAAVCIAIALVAWLLAQRLGDTRRRVLLYTIAAPVFLLALFVFFENFARLLPPNY